jgi:hypothetical protein
MAISPAAPTVRGMIALLTTLVALAGAPDPAQFTTRIDNPYWPMAPGSRWVYRETDTHGAVQRIVVRVTDETKQVASGVIVRVVRDTASENGTVVEDTFDYYAQDDAGNVWYLGEDTTEYENGKPVSKQGSWEAGVDGAEAGIAMLAHPRVGRRYRQEHYPGHAEDGAKVLSRSEQAEVPFGHFTHVLMTKDFNPLEPTMLEYKFYARGIGPVLEIGVSGNSDRAELLRYRRGNG